MRTNTKMRLALLAIALQIAGPSTAAQSGSTELPAAKRAVKSAPAPYEDDFFAGKREEKRDAAAWRRALAHAQLTLEVDGKPEAARDALAKLRNDFGRAADFEGRKDVALELLELSTRVLTQLGDAKAVAALLDPKQARGSWRDALATLEAEPRFLALATRASSSAPDAQEIRRVVVDSLRAGNSALVIQLGVAAAPALEEIVRNEPNALPPLEQDALRLLVRCSSARAARVSSELIAQPNASFLVAKRIARAMNNDHVLGPQSTAWSFEPGDDYQDHAPVLVESEWREVVTALLGMPTIAPDVLGLVEDLVSYDALDSGSRSALAALARSAEPGVSAALARAIGGGAGRASLAPLLVELLTAPSPELRVAAANALTTGPRSEALLARVDDPDKRVRAAVADALRAHKVLSARFKPGSTMLSGGSWQPFDRQDEPKLVRLLDDPAAEVRAKALRIASNEGLPVDTATAARFLEEPNLELRKLVVRCLPMDPELAAPLLGRALRDDDRQVRKESRDEMLRRLGLVSRTPTDLASSAGPLAPAIRDLALLWIVSLQDGSPDSWIWPVVGRLARMPADAQAMVQAYVAAAPVPAVPAWRLASFFAPTKDEPMGLWRILDAHSVEGLLRAVAVEGARAEDVALGIGESERPAAVRAGIAATVRDENVDRIFRTQLLVGLRESPHAADLLTGVLTRPPWVPDPNEAEAQQVSQALDWAVQQGLPVSVLRDAVPGILPASVPDYVVRGIFDELVQRGAMPDEWTEVVLARFPPTQWGGTATAWAVRREAEMGRWAAVRSALAAPGNRRFAIDVIGRAKPAEGLAWLGAYFRDPALTPAATVPMVTAIAGYLSEEAGEILLNGAQVAPTPEVRKACLDGVAEIRAFLDQKASWLQRDSGRMQRDAAILDLAGLLDAKDPLQRAQAARGLATLEAAEYLPRLIRMLQDSDASVRKAAQDALDRLNR